MPDFPDRSQSSTGPWKSMAEHWDLLGPPLRPGPQDIALYQATIDKFCVRQTIERALILGVTPELHGLDWPAGAELVAIDRNREMIDKVWPDASKTARLGEWATDNFAPASMQMVMCDGGLHLLDYPHGQAALVTQLARIVAPGGQVVFRLFLPPPIGVSPQQVIEDLRAGRIRDMNCLKLKLGHALSANPEEGVALDNIWRFLHANIGDRDEFFAGLGWNLEQAEVIDLYRDSGTRYALARLEQIRRLFTADGDGPFKFISLTYPSQEMGDQCPHFVVERL